MINHYLDSDKDIHKRIFNYVVAGLKVIREIPKTTENLPIINQVSRSLTSIGANDQEADVAGSKRDFVAKYVIVRKEIRETIYWWKVLKELGFKNEKLDWLIGEGDEIFKIIYTIIKNSNL